MSSGYIRSLDGVRALAIILVMTFHFELNHFGWLGVQLFFVLSGFLITGILWKEKQKETSLPAKFKKFWARRSLRIFPLYYGYLLFLGLTYLIVHFPSYYSTFIPYLATYTFNFTRMMPEWQVTPLFTHLWSLCVEEQFYLFFPLIVYLCPPRFIKTLMIVVIIAAPFIRLALGMYYTGDEHVVADAVYWNTLSHLDAFFIGGSIPVFGLAHRIQKPRALFFTLLVLAIAAGAAAYANGHSAFSYLFDLGYGHGQMTSYEHVWHYTILNLLFASFILMLLNNRGALTKFLESKILVNIGKVSYGMYVFHWAIMIYGYNKLLPVEMPYWLRILSFIPYLAIVYIFAELSFRFYENKFILLKEKYFS